MTLRSVVSWTFGLLLLTPIFVEAGDEVLTTALIQADRITCTFLNAGPKPVTVSVFLISASGPSIQTTNLSLGDVTFQPGGFAAWGAGDDDLGYCRFEISSGSSAGVRAAACGISIALGNKCATVSEAR